jgi:hypothetical protein
MGIYDLDCCYLGEWQPDGHYIFEQVEPGWCVVVESSNWYAANGFSVGTVLPCQYDFYASVETTRPDPPVNSDTKKSLSYEFPGNGCCNGTDGGAVYVELSMELNLSPCSKGSP